MARTAYIRVSTGKQTYDRQLHDFDKYFERMGMSWNGVEIVSEKITSHTTFKERKLYPILQKAKEGDIIYVCQLDRLGRTMVDILELVDYATNKGVILMTIDNGYQLENKTAMGKLYLGMVAAMAEAERELRSERCQAGIDSALGTIKKNGSRITKRGTIQTHWGNAKGCDMSAANEASAKARAESANKWFLNSSAVKYAIRKRAENWTLQSIADEISQLYDVEQAKLTAAGKEDSRLNPYATPTGCKPNRSTISLWLSRANPLVAI